MKTSFTCLCLMGVLAGTARCEENILPFAKEVRLPHFDGEELAAAVLDSDIFAATQHGLHDVRIFDADGKEIAYVVRKPPKTQSVTVRMNIATRQPSIRLLEDGGMEVTVALHNDSPQPQGVRIVTPLKNFEQRVQILTSRDGKDWQPAGKETAIFDYSRYMDVRNDAVPLPRTTDRYLRLVIDDVTAEQQSELLELTRRLQGGSETERTEKVVVDRRPFRIDRLEFWHDVQQSQSTGVRTTAYPVASFEVREDAETHQTIVTVATRREPLSALSIETEDRNFSRLAEVQVEQTKGTQKSWGTIGSSTLSRIDFKNLQRTSLSLSFPETRAENYRIVIHNRDSPPLKLTGVAAEGDVYEAVFIAAPSKSYRIAYGSAAAAPPNYDSAALEASLAAGYAPKVAELGEETRQTVVLKEQPFDWSKLVNDPKILFPVIGVLVLLVGWGLYHAGRRVEEVSGKPNADSGE